MGRNSLLTIVLPSHNLLVSCGSIANFHPRGLDQVIGSVVGKTISKTSQCAAQCDVTNRESERGDGMRGCSV